MRCLYFDGQLKYRDDYPVPAPAPGEALVKVLYAGVCNTDREILAGYKGFTGILGHEFVGVVEEGAGWEGRRVVADINLGCGRCPRCREGLANHCRSRRVLGITGKDGAFAEYLTLPCANLREVPPGVSDLAAVFAEPLAAALEICDQCHIRPSERIAVLGDGKLGQLVARVLSLTGCDLTVVGKHPAKLALLDGLAATATADAAGKEGPFDLVVECTGSPAGLAAGQDLVKPRGRIVLKSTFASDAVLSSTLWVVRELTLVGSRCGPTSAALRLLARRLVDVEPLVGGVFRLADGAAVFAPPGGLKAIFDCRIP
ncbi:MDR/zinc-dependent alcohol dehydrogenase-like family protein [Anaeroselena agilis]|uniref:Alcohol dehydrogenase catalytic domain-containing protein n=1 Tax=Anaeroselena agilis TaxID=3063788 RepID=A0ABU3P1F2_9FIRM|nr:alcohol dehydrogenase catalytic domain-containing protein [Selenomonadales bacterium 4137-cl]